MPAGLADNYKSLAQQARVVSEGWGNDNLFCPNCPSPTLNPAPNNTQAFDFLCSNCKSSFQLKSKWPESKDDAGYCHGMPKTTTPIAVPSAIISEPFVAAGRVSSPS